MDKMEEGGDKEDETDVLKIKRQKKGQADRPTNTDKCEPQCMTDTKETLK